MPQTGGPAGTPAANGSPSLRVLDLFSGIGGFSLGLERAGMRTVAFCEIEPYCRAVLRNHWPLVPCFEDVRSLHASDVGAIDVICGGFPCQPFSQAGKRLGNEDHRALWPEYFRLIQECRPTWVIGENVIGLRDMGLDEVLTNLEDGGYSTRTFDIPAGAIGANHRRRRLWIIANAQSEQNRGGIKPKLQPYTYAAVNANAESIQGACADSEVWRNFAYSLGGIRKHWEAGWPISAPRLCRLDDGVPDRVGRLKASGNAVVPQIPEIIGRAIIAAMGPP